MDSEAKIIIAFLFYRSGKTALKESELYLSLSVDLGWFTTTEAKAFLQYAHQNDLLKKKGNVYTPTFTIDTIKIPVGFSPKQKQFEEEIQEEQDEQPPLLNVMIKDISDITKKKYEEVLEEITAISKEKNILPEVAALIVAKKNQLDITLYYEDIEKYILRGNEG